MNDGQTEASASSAGSEEGFQCACLHLVTHATAVVLDHQGRHVISLLKGDVDLAIVAQRLAGVDRQVEQDLLDGSAVDASHHGVIRR